MNVLWICSDQQRSDTLGCYGNEFVKTPNIDRLAKMGIRFDRAYSQSPVCAPSRASFLTGRYPRTCSVRQNGQDINEDEKLITKLLSENGYTCGLSGKLHISACNQSVCKTIERRIDDGYDYFKWSHHPAPVNKTNNWPMNDYTIWLKNQGVSYDTPQREDCKYVNVGVDPEYHQSKWCADMAIEYIDSVKEYGLPWLFSVNLYDPHHPFDPPKEYLDRYMDILDHIPLPNYVEGELDNKPVFQTTDHNGAYDTKGNFSYMEMTEYDHKLLRASYWAMVDLIDVQVGRLLDYLEETNQLNDTMIIFTSDHGENLGDHGMYLKGPYFYENNVHVPLIITYPSVIEGGRTSNALVELVDLAPTICNATGIPVYEGMQGKSLWKLLSEEASADKHRDSIYCEYYNSNINHRNPLAFGTMVYDGKYKLVKIHDKNNEIKCKGELYDLEKDPAETTNRFYDAEYKDIKIRMLELMCDRMVETVDPLPLRRAYW